MIPPILRQKAITKQIMDAKVVGIDELAKMFGVSSMTIRRDIEALEEAGHNISLARGMAIVKDSAGAPTPFTFFYREMSRPEMDHIARAAEPLVGKGATIYMDSGPTTMALARKLCEKRGKEDDLFVVTSDLAIGVLLIENSNFRIYHTGGMVSRESNSCSGVGAAKALKGFYIDIAFFTTPSWNSKWLTTLDAEKSPLKKAAVAASHTRVLLSDSTKYGKLKAFKCIPMSSIDLIITDSNVPKNALETFAKLETKVMIAPKK